MTIEWVRWAMTELPLCVGVILATHLVMSGGQTVLHCWLGHHRIGGVMCRSHIRFHHGRYARGHLTSVEPESTENDITPYFSIPVLLAGAAVWWFLPLPLFVAMALAVAASFFAHVWFDRSYHMEGPYLERFAWFRRKRQLHFVHHLHANANFAVIDFFWDRVLGTFREPDQKF